MTDENDAPLIMAVDENGPVDAIRFTRQGAVFARGDRESVLDAIPGFGLGMIRHEDDGVTFYAYLDLDLLITLLINAVIPEDADERTGGDLLDAHMKAAGDLSTALAHAGYRIVPALEELEQEDLAKMLPGGWDETFIDSHLLDETRLAVDKGGCSHAACSCGHPSLDEMEAREDEMIARFGHMVQGVFPTAADPGPHFCYTIGLAEKGWPEIILFGLTLDAGGPLLNQIVEIAKRADAAPTAGTIEDERFLIPLHLLEVPDGAADAYVGRARARLHRAVEGGGPDSVRVLQLVYSDRSGLYPWSPGYDSAQFDQPLIGILPTRH